MKMKTAINRFLSLAAILGLCFGLAATHAFAQDASGEKKDAPKEEPKQEPEKQEPKKDAPKEEPKQEPAQDKSKG